MPRILLLGFSVTGDHVGYAAGVRELAAAHPECGIEVVVCGAGGVNILPMTAIYESVLCRKGPFDHVVLEIATTVHAQQIADWQRDGLDPLYDLLDRVVRSGAMPALVNHYRDDFDYPYHVYDMVLEALSARHGIPLLDMGAGLLRREGREACRAKLRDLVHTNPAGSAFQAAAVWAFVREIARSGRRPSDLPAPRWNARALDIAEHGRLPTARFALAGLELDCGVLNAGEACTLAIPEGVEIFGFSFVSGPLTGDFELDLTGAGRTVRIPTYDEHCFFRRYNFSRLGRVTGCPAVTIRQRPEIPSIKLRKREPDLSPRVGNAIALHYFERATAE